MESRERGPANNGGVGRHLGIARPRDAITFCVYIFCSRGTETLFSAAFMWKLTLFSSAFECIDIRKWNVLLRNKIFELVRLVSGDVDNKLI